MAQEYNEKMLDQLSYLEFIAAYSERNIEIGGRDLFSAVTHYVTRNPDVLAGFSPMKVLSSALETQPAIDIAFLKDIQTQILSSAKVIEVLKGKVISKPGVKETLTALSWAINFGIAGKNSVQSK